MRDVERFNSVLCVVAGLLTLITTAFIMVTHSIGLGILDNFRNLQTETTHHINVSDYVMYLTMI